MNLYQEHISNEYGNVVTQVQVIRYGLESDDDFVPDLESLSHEIAELNSYTNDHLPKLHYTTSNHIISTETALNNYMDNKIGLDEFSGIIQRNSLSLARLVENT